MSHTPGRKTTVQEQENRIDQICLQISHGATKHQLKTFIREQWGIGYRNAENLICKARNRIAESLKMSPEELHKELAQSLHFYKSVLSSPRANLKEKLQARKQADNILGFNRLKIDVDHQMSGDVADDSLLNVLTDEERAKIEEAQEILARASITARGMEQAAKG